jgi:hypothetical protein
MRKSLVLALAMSLPLSVAMAFQPGGSAFTKKKSTALLDGPKRAAATSGTLPFATKVKVLAVQGVWVQVSAGGKTGWIFNGNLSEDKPAAQNTSKLTTTAANTTAATAARPLSSVAKDYAGRTSQGSAVADIEWMERVADSVSASAVNSYMKQNGKGEFSK